MEGGVPGGEPRVFPLVGHGENVLNVEVVPVVVAPGEAAGGRVGHLLVALEPCVDHVVEELLCPQQAGIAMAADESLLG